MGSHRFIRGFGIRRRALVNLFISLLNLVKENFSIFSVSVS
jgi:hypothetical protein